MTDIKNDDLEVLATLTPDRRSPHERELDEALQQIAAAAHERMREVLRHAKRIPVRRKDLAHLD